MSAVVVFVCDECGSEYESGVQGLCPDCEAASYSQCERCGANLNHDWGGFCDDCAADEGDD